MDQWMIAVDIGNTNTDVGLVDCHNFTCEKRFTFPSAELEVHAPAALDGCRAYQKAMKKSEPRVAATTVIPGQRELLTKICASIFKTPLIWTEYRPSLPLKVNYQSPEKLGADRLVNALYAQALYPDNDCIIIDSGTTVTVDLLKNNEFCGGAIVPGIMTQLKSLHAHTAALPHADIAAIRKDAFEFPGLSTEACMVGGVTVGMAGSLNAMVKYFSSQYQKKPLVLATGGLWEASASFVEFEYIPVPNLTLIGTAICTGYLL